MMKKMAILSNPTLTRGIEKAWRREINRRWRRFNKAIANELRRLDGLTVNLLTPDEFQLRAFMVFVNQQIDELILGGWQSKYQLRSYELALERSIASLSRQLASVNLTEVDAALAAQISSFTAVSALGVGLGAGIAIANPIHQDALEFLFSRGLGTLDNIGLTMANDIRNILFNAVREGKGIREIVREILGRTSVGRSRARLIAQTETIQAYHHATVNQAEIDSEFLGEDVLIRWLTTRRKNVRHLHRGWHGDVTTPKEARRRFNISPFNCHCGLVPVIEEADTPVKRKKFKTEKKELQALEE